MFINCPYCRTLIATDLATDLPPAHCPQCRGPLRDTSTTSTLGNPQDDRTTASIRAETQADSHTSASADSPLRDVAIDPTGDGLAAENEIAKSHSDSASDIVFMEELMDEPPPWQETTPSHEVDAQPDGDSQRFEPIVEQENINGGMYDDDRRDDAALPVEVDATSVVVAHAEDAIPAASPANSSIAQDQNIEVAATVAPQAQRSTMRSRAGQQMPSFARKSADKHRIATTTRVWPAVAAILALSALLVLQLLLADRARLAANANWRPLLNTLCSALHCELPPWREPTAFALLQRDVRQHPNAPGALRVSASFRNDARWPQPWPMLELTLSDVNGRVAGERRFQAREYLGDEPEQPMLASGETATVAMDILEPAAQIVAYDFQFH
jgi:hypothetical protein